MPLRPTPLRDSPGPGGLRSLTLVGLVCGAMCAESARAGGLNEVTPRPLAVATPNEGEEVEKKWMTASEVRPILRADRLGWVYIDTRRSEDRLFFTRLDKLRCGLQRIRYSINGGQIREYTPERCYEDLDDPNRIRRKPKYRYVAFPADGIQQISVEVTYDDGATDVSSVDRAQIAR